MGQIRKVVLKNFKRFGEVEFSVPGHLVLAGPNNTGKTTLLQAIAAWALGLSRWLELGADNNPRRNGFPWQDLERAQFSAVALRSFDQLWHNRARNRPLEIGVQFDGHPSLCVLEFYFRASGLASVRPKSDFPVALARAGALGYTTTFIPAIAGLAREEHQLANPEAIRSLLAQARAGEVLRNLLVLAYQRQEAWRDMTAVLARMFGIELLPPGAGAELACEYRKAGDAAAPVFDISATGSGVLQVLLVLSLMVTQEGNVLLIDEPDAHLHLILQKSIYGELRSLAARRRSQLIIATHSEQVIESVDPRELCLMYGRPRLVADQAEKVRVAQSLGVLTHGDLLAANGARGVLYVEDFTDHDLLIAWARALGDVQALELLTVGLVIKRAQAPAPDGLGEIEPQRHWELLRLVSDALPALYLVDGDSKVRAPDHVTGTAERMQRLRWGYCEIENYLLHPAALARALESLLGPQSPGVQAAMDELRRVLQDSFMENPFEPQALQRAYLESRPASKELLPAMLQAAGLNQFPKTRYFEIAQQFAAHEVHPEVRRKLALLKFAFGCGPHPDALAHAGAATQEGGHA